MKTKFILIVLLFPLLVNAQISLNEWQTISPVSDSSHHNRNACMQGYNDDIMVFWEQEVNSTTTRICYKDFSNPQGAIQVAIEQDGVKLTNPQILELDPSNKNFLLLYQSNEGTDTDLKYIIFHQDGSISAPFVLSASPGDETNLCISQYTVAWENNGKIYISEYQPLSNIFLEPYLVEANGAFSPTFSDSQLKYLVPAVDSTLLVTKQIYYNQGNWVVYQTMSQAYKGQCTGGNSNNMWAGGNQFCMQQDIPGIPSGIIILNSWEGEEYHRSPQYNYTDPAICDFMIGVKSSLGLYFLAYSSDSLSQQEIFAENPHFFIDPVNISLWPGNDRNPRFFVTFVDYYLMRVHLFWESDREGFSTIYRTYLDYIFGGTDEAPKAENLQVSPCPFEHETTITIQSGAKTRIRIYDLQGREIKSLTPQPADSGWQKAVWDGTNYQGNSVLPGSYMVVAGTGNAMQSRIIIRK